MVSLETIVLSKETIVNARLQFLRAWPPRGSMELMKQSEICRVMRQFLIGEVGRYGRSNGLRAGLIPVLSDPGFLISPLPVDTLATVAATGDPEALNGSLRYFGLSDAMIRVCAAREEAFLCDLVGSCETRRMFTCCAYHSCVSGLAMRTGRDERVTLLPIQPSIAGSNYEGWSEIVTQDETSLESLEMTLAYGTVPHPPSLAVVTAVEETDTVRVAGEVVMGGAEWVASRLLGLRAIVLLAFDNDSLLFWVPGTDSGEATVKAALDQGLAIMQQQGGSE